MLYQNEGIYRYKGGVNWRAVVALVIVIPVNLPGLINAIDKSVQTGNHKFFCEFPLFLLIQTRFIMSTPLVITHFDYQPHPYSHPFNDKSLPFPNPSLTHRPSIMVNFILHLRHNLPSPIQDLPPNINIRRSNSRITR